MNLYKFITTHNLFFKKGISDEKEKLHDCLLGRKQKGEIDINMFTYNIYWLTIGYKYLEFNNQILINYWIQIFGV